MENMVCIQFFLLPSDLHVPAVGAAAVCRLGCVLGRAARRPRGGSRDDGTETRER